MSQASWAAEIARNLLEEPLPRRWSHTQGVARRAQGLAPVLGKDADLLEAAAWLHDIGYSPSLVVTGFHPLDGARYLRGVERAGEHLCGLVAHHSCAANEAEERGLLHELVCEFEPANQLLSDALTYSDMTTTPAGQPIAVESRLAEIQSRYGEGHLVTRSISRSSPRIVRSIRAIERIKRTIPFS
ncbi:HDIG domain-containing protein [Actinoallomurus bryophytorum]|uniref:HD domain-containing protein n=1 Tax=Actinoallomurus bryophytorum TaxID=1490222 RepID=A0A543CKU0_9ACTN|nr:HD domain-containing protein [Actinoallomurus bryophytorum]TQL97705.1 HD domain-containing protein [Actinoallomurus bryophytorum]